VSVSTEEAVALVTCDVQLRTLYPSIGGIVAHDIIAMGHVKAGTNSQVWRRRKKEKFIIREKERENLIL
jgi:hypothetical protein